MNEKLEEAEKNKLKEAYKLYSSKTTQLWNKLLKKYNFDEQAALTIIADFWYEPDNAEEFEEEWMNGTDEIRSEVENKFGIFIEHEEEMITVRNEYFVYDGIIVVEEK